MILAKDLFLFLKKKISFYTGVPDSVLKNLIDCFDNNKKIKHIISPNEGSAIALAIGNFLSTKKIPCVYMQNSGLGNAINPLISIAHKKVYSIPLFLLIGWRGSPKKNDEPQHLAKGKITPDLLKLLNIKFCILKGNKDFKKINKLIKYAYSSKSPVACLIEKDNIELKKIKKKNNNNFLRKDFIFELLKNIPNNSRIISTTGYTSRELHQIRKQYKITKGKDFYMVGGMGHSAMVALGYSLYSNKQIICLDGDGSILMHLGSLRTLGFFGKKNIKHILLNNNSHESVGGQTTTAYKINFKKLVLSLGYKKYYKINKKINLNLKIKNFLKSKGPSFLEVIISNGSLSKLSRPKKLIQIKNRFMI